MFVFKFIHSFTANDICMRRSWNKLSSIVLPFFRRAVYSFSMARTRCWPLEVCLKEVAGFNNFMNHEQLPFFFLVEIPALERVITG